MRINQALQQNKQKLTKTSNTPELDTEVLLCFVLNKPKEYLYTYPEYELTEKEEEIYFNCIKKRLSGAPIAHITGFKEFYGRKFIVTADTLVPRPETEMMIDFVKKNHESRIMNHKDKNTTFIDIGTGSGCIIVTIAKELNPYPYRHKFYAVDISEKALNIAKQNAKKHEVGDIIKFYHSNLLEPLLCHSGANAIESHKLTIKPNQRDPISRLSSFQDDSSIVIIANLPYLTPEQIKNAPSIHAEPELALTAGDDGLKYYRELFKQIKEIMNYESGIMVLCEIDDSQTNSITTLVKKELPNFSIKIKKDLAGLSRLVVLEN